MTKRPRSKDRPTTYPYWAQLSRRTGDGRAGDNVGFVKISPSFTSLAEVGNWLRESGYNPDTDIVAAYKREGGRDQAVRLAGEEPVADQARLRELIGRTRDMLAERDPAKRDRLRAEAQAIAGGGDAVVTDPPARTRTTLPPSTAVTESPEERARIVRMMEETRAQRAAEPKSKGFDALTPMLKYADVYDQQGRVRPEYEAEVQRMRETFR